MADTLREHLNQRYSALKTERSSWESHWRELSEYVMPRRGRFLMADYNKGSKRNTKILDNTGTLAARTLASGMMAGITSPSRPWFRLTTPDPGMMDYAPVKTWLHDVETILREIFTRSNFYNALHTLYTEHGVYGQAPILIDEDYEDVIRAYQMTCGSYYMAVSDRNIVDTIYREMPLTVKQVVQWFGLENVSQTVKNLYEKSNYDATVKVIHAIEPNDRRNRAFKDKRNMAYRSIYWEDGQDKQGKFLLNSGYREFPGMAPRWDVIGNDVYGRSPAMDALGDIKQLQAEQKHKAHGIEKLVNPPMVGPASLDGRVSNTLPGGVTYLDVLTGQQGFVPAYQIQPQIQHLTLDIQDVRQRISRAFYEDLFLMLAQSDRREITAREVEERHEEKLLMLGPVLERLHDELLDPAIDRTFNIALRAGILPEPPEELAGQALRVEYISIMAQAQKLIGTASMERFSGFVGNLAAVNPEVLDKYDMDQAVDEYADMTGVPPRIVRSDDDVVRMRQERAQQQQALQQAQMGMAAAQGAKVLSEADTGEDTNLLQRVLGG